MFITFLIQIVYNNKKKTTLTNSYCRIDEVFSISLLEEQFLMFFKK